MNKKLFIVLQNIMMSVLLVVTPLQGERLELGTQVSAVAATDITLTQWTEDVLARCPEYLGNAIDQAKDHHTALTSTQFKRALEQYCTVHETNESFKDSSKWVDGTMFTPYKNNQSFAQKVVIPNGSEVFFCGDLHGSIHSFLRTLWRLVVQGYLSDDFTIKQNNFYMIFLGDYVDRGWYGSEVIYTLCKLKKANENRIFLLRGNHEERSMSDVYGFTGMQTYGRYSTIKSSEIGKKFKDEATELLSTIERWYKYLPHVLFLDNGTASWLQCCHGGIEKNYIPKRFLDDGESIYQVLQEPHYEGLNWSDVVIGDHCSCKRSSRGAGWETSVGFVKDYLQKNGLKALMRGHADMEFWFKLFFPSELVKIDSVTGEYYLENEYDRYYFQDDPMCAGGKDSHGNPVYEKGPYNWRKVLSQEDLENYNGFLLSHYPPIFTFSNASESRRLVDGDGYAIVCMDGDFEQWKAKTYPLLLDNPWERNTEVVRYGKYMSISLGDDAISQEHARYAGTFHDYAPLISLSWHRYPVEHSLNNRLKNFKH